MVSIEVWHDIQILYRNTKDETRQDSLLQQSLKRNVTHEGYDKVTTKDQDIEVADMSQHLKNLSRQTI